jgi:uncharacterized protein YggU (UPF0235/DUF167 family)
MLNKIEVGLVVKTHQKASELRKIENQTSTLFISESLTQLENIRFFEDRVKSLPINNQANIEVINLLVAYFNVSKSEVQFKSGQKSK